jgi:hypothetical protein
MENTSQRFNLQLDVIILWSHYRVPKLRSRSLGNGVSSEATKVVPRGVEYVLKLQKSFLRERRVSSKATKVVPNGA